VWSVSETTLNTTVPWAADHATWIFRVQEGPFGCGTGSDAGTMGGSMCNIRLAGGMALPMGALNSMAGPAQVGWTLALLPNGLQAGRELKRCFLLNMFHKFTPDTDPQPPSRGCSARPTPRIRISTFKGYPSLNKFHKFTSDTDLGVYPLAQVGKPGRHHG